MHIPDRQRWHAMSRALVEAQIIAQHEAGVSLDEIVESVTPMSLKGVKPLSPLAGAVRATITRHEQLKEQAKRESKKRKAK